MNTNKNKVIQTIERAAICQFMGFEYCGKNYYHVIVEGIDAIIPLLAIEFNTDWRLLMSLVEKIENTLDDKGYGYNVEQNNSMCAIFHQEFGDEIIPVQKGIDKFEATLTVCVEFINWYKQNQNQNE